MDHLKSIKLKSGDNPLIAGKEIYDSNIGEPDGPYRVIMDNMQSGVEANYFWIKRFLEHRYPHGINCSGGRGRIEKLKDLYLASEASSYWGNIETRRSTQIEKYSQMMQTIGGMLKSTFQMLRELRILDERIEYYDGYKTGDETASHTLKSYWTDIVEGGHKSPLSVFGLAGQIGYATLPDLFFSINPKTKGEVDREMRKISVNKRVKSILGKKLKQFLVWKEKTEIEIRTRKNFMLKYLRQHFNAIKLNINWLKPYLRSIKRLEFDESISRDPDLLKSLETAKSEIEIMGIRYIYEYIDPKKDDFKTDYKFKKWKPCILIRFWFIAMPQMSFQKEYSRGAIQTGRTIMQIEHYAATEEQIKAYKKSLEDDDIEILASLNESLNAMKEDLDKYLEQAGETIKKDEEKKQEKPEGILSPLKSVASGFKEIFSLAGIKKREKGKYVFTPRGFNEKKEKAAAQAEAKFYAYVLYDIFKKTHRMMAP